MLQTEHEFTLPVGYVDEDGTLHRKGQMRLATAADEILPLEDSRAQDNPAWLVIVLLARVVTKLGSLSDVTPEVIDALSAPDLACLGDLFNRLNRHRKTAAAVRAFEMFAAEIKTRRAAPAKPAE